MSSVYADSDAFYVAMRALFERLAADPAATAQFQRARMAIRIRSTDPQAEIYLDSRNNPVRVEFGPYAGNADLELTLPADLLHQIWLGEVRLRDAFFSGQIHTTGNVFRAMSLGDLFRQAEALYPSVLQSLGYEL